MGEKNWNQMDEIHIWMDASEKLPLVLLARLAKLYVPMLDMVWVQIWVSIDFFSKFLKI
jgi:hypothetical protein